MITDPKELARRWEESAGQVAAVLQAGEDACFLTLGDPLLYSTYIYLLRALRKILPGVPAVTVPGVTAFSAAAALTDFPIGEAKEPVTIVPTADDLQALEEALDRGGTVVLMKIGKRLGKILDLLEKKKADGSGRFCVPVGHPEQRLETDLRKLRAEGPEAGYLSIILVHGIKFEIRSINSKQAPMIKIQRFKTKTINGFKKYPGLSLRAKRSNPPDCQSLFYRAGPGVPELFDPQGRPAPPRLPMLHLCRFPHQPGDTETSAGRSRALRFGQNGPPGNH